MLIPSVGLLAATHLAILFRADGSFFSIALLPFERFATVLLYFERLVPVFSNAQVPFGRYVSVSQMLESLSSGLPLVSHIVGSLLSSLPLFPKCSSLLQAACALFSNAPVRFDHCAA